MAERRARCVFQQAFDRILDSGVVPAAPGQAYGLGQGWRSWLGAVAAVVAPAECRVCALPLVRAGLFPVCAQCIGGLAPPAHAGCSRCGEALAMESARAAGLSRTDAPLCDACSAELPPFERAAAFGTYGGGLRALIHLYKFDGVRPLRKPLGLHMAEAMVRACDGVAGPVAVVAVPLYRGKRAFNQSADMANEAIRQIGAGQPFQLRAVHGLLRRTRQTESQAHLSLRERRQNVRGAFAVTGDVRGAQVLLVDDVYTTGATVGECTRVLLRAGAAPVRVATLARTQRRSWTAWDTAALDTAAWGLSSHNGLGAKG